MALGYKQQQRVEETWRTMKSGLKMRPVFHWASHRIHAHIAITVLSLLLERTIEHACQDTWRNIRDDLKRIQLAQLLTGQKYRRHLDVEKMNEQVRAFSEAV